MTQPEWDIKLTAGSNGQMETGRYGLPAEIFRMLAEKEMWRAKLEVTDEGLLFRPYAAPRRGQKQVLAETPKWAK